MGKTLRKVEKALSDMSRYGLYRLPRKDKKDSWVLNMTSVYFYSLRFWVSLHVSVDNDLVDYHCSVNGAAEMEERVILRLVMELGDLDEDRASVFVKKMLCTLESYADSCQEAFGLEFESRLPDVKFAIRRYS